MMTLIKRNTLSSKVVLCVTFALVMGCSTSRHPNWILDGAGAFPKEKGFYGVGTVSGVKNIALAYRAADSQARIAVAKQFEVYTASLMGRYVASTTDTDLKRTVDEQNVEEETKTFKAASMSGIQIVDHYEARLKDGIPTLYSLAKLDIHKVKKNVAKVQQLSPQIRNYVRENADKVFDELKNEGQKKN